MRRLFDFAALSLLVAFSSPAEAANFDDPTWPCVQRKVPNLSIGQMWSGPILSEEDKGSLNDEAVETLAAALAVRRTTMEEAEVLVEAFASSSSKNLDARLTHLFHIVFERINSERGQLISGISRYAGRQSDLAERINTLNEEVVALEAKEDKSFDEFDTLEELADKIDWDKRIFTERQESLTYVCETPVILEKRAFALARIIMNRME